MTKIIGSAFHKLVREFSEIKIEIKPIDVSYKYENGDEYGNVSVGKEYQYHILFQGDFIIKRDADYPTKEYYDFLVNLKNEYYREINDHIENFIDKELVLNDLSNHKLQFEELIRLYKIDEESNNIVTSDNFFSHKNVIVEEDEYKPVNLAWMIRISNNLFQNQLHEIHNIILFLKEKIEIVKSFLETIRQATKKNKFKKPLEKLDRYQTALLFFYLNEAGLIQYKSSNEIAPIVQSLTGHSAHNMQTKAFNKIPDVKKGQAGNKLKISNNKSYNLIEVKNTILEILRMVNDDLEKNKSLQ